MGLIVTIVLGALIGWIASIIMKTNASMGAIANIIAGIVGSAIGGFIFGTAHGLVGQIVVGVIGACILIGIVKLITGASGRTV